jgi:hypothetical protein
MLKDSFNWVDPFSFPKLPKKYLPSVMLAAFAVRQTEAEKKHDSMG